MEPSGGAPLPDVALDGESVQLTPHAGAEDWVAAPPAADETPPVPKKTKGKLVGSALLLVAAGALLALLSKLADREQKVEPPPAPPLPEGLLLPPQPVEVFKPPASQQASQAESEAQSARAPLGMPGLLPHINELKSVLKRREERSRGSTDSSVELAQATSPVATEQFPNQASLPQGGIPAPPPDPQSLGNVY